MSIAQPASVQEQLEVLRQFRQAAYECLGPARDAQFELTDAVLLTPGVQSFVELSQSPVFRRRWSSAYAALADGRPNRAALLRLYVQQIPALPRPILAGDHTAWPRLAARTVRDRTVEHQPTKVPGNKPITVGHGFSTLAWVPEAAGSWALPLLHERITSQETPMGKMVTQLWQVCPRLPVRPIVLLDSEYGCASFVIASADVPADKVMRLRPNRCLYGPPPPYAGLGRPRKHGAKFKLAEASTWGPPAATLAVEDPDLGPVRVQLWRDLHFQAAADYPLLVVRIERLQARGTRRDPKDLWLGWEGQEPPPLDQWWWLYLRRFAVDHWYRFAKQRQHWTLPRVGTPEQAERWSDLMPLITWELWLAREIVADCPRPWQKPQRPTAPASATPSQVRASDRAPQLTPPDQSSPALGQASAAPMPERRAKAEGRRALTPSRVCQGMGGVLAAIGTPAQAPKPRGNSLGWPTGRLRRRRVRYPVVKKSRKRKKKAA